MFFQLWIFSKVVELYLKWIYPLKKYKMIPGHGFLQQISSCMFTSLPSNFYDRVEEGSLILRKYERLNFCKNGLLVDREMSPLATDIVILATGFRSDEKLKNIFKSTYFQKHIAGSAPFYRYWDSGISWYPPLLFLYTDGLNFVMGYSYNRSENPQCISNKSILSLSLNW